MFKKIKDTSILRNARQGLEREALRVDGQGRIATNLHPNAFGSPLTNPYITLDFSEAQLEFITPPLKGGPALRGFLEKLYAWSYRQIGRELLWPFSMPGKLPEHRKIALAQFGASVDAEAKRIYREGLKQRYGGAVQTISGIHYNFSLSESFWSAYARECGILGDISSFKDEQYFSLMRNVIRYVPLVTYLFGASPAADKSFFTSHPESLKQLDASTWYGPWATSLRLSDFGYHNAKRSPASVSFNSLSEYVNDLYKAVSTPSKLWSALGTEESGKQIQLNTNILQLENEFYASIRPKQKTHMHPGESVLCSLACAGVEYVELRSIDLDPYDPAGIGEEELSFLHAFMTYCLLVPSARFKEGEQKKLEDTHSLVALMGRKPGLAIDTGSRKEIFSAWASKALKAIAEVAELLDEAHETKRFSRVVAAQAEKLADSELTPSARVIREMREKGISYALYGVALAKSYKASARALALSASYQAEMKELARISLEEASRREAYDDWILKGYEHLELSTQIVIRAAQKRGIVVEVLDPTLNVIELTKGKKKEVVKQGTITRYDNYLGYELMNHKSLTKLFLLHAGISTPQGERFTDKQEALDFYPAHCSHALVVKPSSTNYGTGVSIVRPRGDKAYQLAVERAFKHDSTILVEEFIPGKEYRFLVIAGKVIAVLNRDPANVIGDGIHSIRELVEAKNTDPLSYKLPEKYIHLRAVEKEILAEAKLTPDSVPSRNRKVYLRKNSNVNDGGDPIDIPDMPAAYKRIAIRAARTVGANICGVDMIIKDPLKVPKANNHSIIELNWNPALYLHGYPIKGKRRDVGGAVLDFLGF